MEDYSQSNEEALQLASFGHESVKFDSKKPFIICDDFRILRISVVDSEDYESFNPRDSHRLKTIRAEQWVAEDAIPVTAGNKKQIRMAKRKRMVYDFTNVTMTVKEFIEQMKKCEDEVDFTLIEDPED